MRVKDKETEIDRQRESYLLQATNKDLAWFALKHQQAGTEFLEGRIQIHKALDQEPDPVQAGQR